MNIMRVVALALACSGCAQLFGIEDTSSGQTATLDLQRVSVGAKVVTAPLDLGTNVPSFVAADGVRTVSAMPAMPGQWTAPIADPLAAVFTAPDLPKPFQHALELGTAEQSASFVAFEHPDPQPAPASMLMLNVTLPGAFATSTTLEVLVIGAWTEHQLAGSELPAAGATTIATTLPYASFQAVTASAPAKITIDDAVLVLRYAGNVLTGALVAPAFDQTGGTDAVTGTMAAVTPAAPFDATIDVAGAISRFAIGMPKNGSPAFAWELDASPGASAGVTTGVRLTAGTLATTDKTFSGMYANPFAQMWPATLTYFGSELRTYTLGGASVTLSSSLATIAEPAAGLHLDLPAGLPTVITLAGTALSSDGMTVPLDPTVALQVEINSDRATNTAYAVTLEEITVVGASVTRAPVVSVTGTTPQLVLPPNVLAVGHTYTLTATCVQGGYTNAAAGDLQTVTLPVSFGSASSGVFTVTAM